MWIWLQQKSEKKKPPKEESEEKDQAGEEDEKEIEGEGNEKPIKREENELVFEKKEFTKKEDYIQWHKNFYGMPDLIPLQAEVPNATPKTDLSPLPLESQIALYKIRE